MKRHQSCFCMALLFMAVPVLAVQDELPFDPKSPAQDSMVTNLGARGATPGSLTLGWSSPRATPQFYRVYAVELFYRGQGVHGVYTRELGQSIDTSFVMWIDWGGVPLLPGVRYKFGVRVQYDGRVGPLVWTDDGVTTQPDFEVYAPRSGDTLTSPIEVRWEKKVGATQARLELALYDTPVLRVVGIQASDDTTFTLHTPGAGWWKYRVVQFKDGQEFFSATGWFYAVQGMVGLGVHPQTPIDYALYQNYPNPFNPETTIRYQLSVAGHVRLSIYSVLGQEVRRLVDRSQSAASHVVVWDGRDNAGNSLPSGIYFYRLESGSFTAMKKMILMK